MNAPRKVPSGPRKKKKERKCIEHVRSSCMFCGQTIVYREVRVSGTRSSPWCALPINNATLTPGKGERGTADSLIANLRYPLTARRRADKSQTRPPRELSPVDLRCYPVISIGVGGNVCVYVTHGVRKWLRMNADCSTSVPALPHDGNEFGTRRYSGEWVLQHLNPEIRGTRESISRPSPRKRQTVL